MKSQRWSLFPPNNRQLWNWIRGSVLRSRSNHPGGVEGRGQTRPLSTTTSPSSSSSYEHSTFSSPFRYRALETLNDATLENFREKCFNPQHPAILPRGQFRYIPAFERWFNHTAPSYSEDNVSRLNIEHLKKYSADAFVPLELTQPVVPNPRVGGTTTTIDSNCFQRFHAPLSLFLDWIRQTSTNPSPSQTRLYLAQCQLLDLPRILRDDFPAPNLVLHAGKGDIYDTNIWIGLPPTYTPLHRDPNPNLFVQLAGRKTVRILAPDDGLTLFASVRRRLGRSGGREAAVFRGEEMMQGEERALLEQAVWNDSGDGGDVAASGEEGYEACLGAGDGLFIPNGWWHSIKGVGEDVTGSVNWWFR